MTYNFDKTITQDKNSYKWNWYSDNKDVISMWVADMDFETSYEIKEALSQRALEGIYGYTIESTSFTNTIVNWQLKKHNWKIENDWIVSSPEVITSINLTIQSNTNIGDCIVIQTPVYNLFYDCILNNNRVVLRNPLIKSDKGYIIDFNELEELFKKNPVKIFLLCNPHNPTGKVYSKDELTNLILLCKKYNIVVVSDEIHEDLVFPDHRHITLGLFYQLYDNIIILTSPSKTFNIAGLKVSNTIIPNITLRQKYLAQRKKNGPTALNIFALVGCEAAYLYGDSWLKQVLSYIKSNRDYSINYFKKYLPYLKIFCPGGTYFLWIDCSYLNLVGKKLDNFFINEAKIRIVTGEVFGKEGINFVRMNIACRHKILRKALNNITIAINSLKNQ